MRRREFMRLVGSAVAAFPLSAVAQSTAKSRRIAFVHTGIPADQLTESAGPFWVRHFYQTLRELGDIEGQNILVERYSAEGRSDRFASIAAEVVSRSPDVIVCNFNDLVKIFLGATTEIPIVGITGDPIAGGLLKNLSRPGGNLTGVSINAGVEIYGKRLQILKEMLPSATRVTYLLSGAWEESPPMSSYREAGQQLGIQLTPNLIGDVNETQLHRVFAEMAEQRVEAAMIDEGGSFLAQRALIVQLAGRFRIPLVYPYRDYVEAGGLLAYAPDLAELAQRLATDVHQILGGAKPGDIPWLQPSKFQLIINMKAVKSLGLSMPLSLLARADEAIE